MHECRGLEAGRSLACATLIRAADLTSDRKSSDRPLGRAVSGDTIVGNSGRACCRVISGIGILRRILAHAQYHYA
jgi:hypothetical protein